MKLYGIFDKNNNNKLLRYSQVLQGSMIYEKYDPETKTKHLVEEFCLADIEYSEENIGKSYNISTNSFE